MAFAPQRGDVQISLSVFGGLVTVQSAATLPEGVSPDNQDVAYLPGSVSSRGALQKIFTVALPTEGGLLPTVAWAKTFIGPTGAIENLYLSSGGNLYWEDPVAALGVYNLFGAVTPGSWAKSLTAYGREFIAFSDGLHGSDVPLHWDGTNLDRVTQDGPGAPPSVTTIALPKVGLAVIAGSGPTLADVSAGGIHGIVTADLVNGYYTSLILSFTAPATLELGTPITVSGTSNAIFNSYLTGVTEILSPTSVKLGGFFYASLQVSEGGTATGTVAMTMSRAGNVVTVGCAAAHRLQVGYQAQVAGVPSLIVGTSISSIVINNGFLPGVATVTMVAAHKLTPGIYVSIKGVVQTSVGGTVTLARAGNVVTATCSTDPGLSPGAVVTFSGFTPTSFNTTAMVLSVLGPIGGAWKFTFAQVDTDGAGTGGAINLNWPVPDGPLPTYYEVLSCPTTTSFQVAVNYSDGSWGAGGTVIYEWNGAFFVTALISTTVFQYQQYGPEGSTADTGGTVTPFGQVAPGPHQCQVHFLTRKGYITRPSPPVKFTASGGEYISMSGIPIGPANIVVARILSFTGASGSTFFYLPSTPQVNGQIVGTETQINDNTTTATTLDFSDPALFAGLGISIPGNDISSQIILDGALGFGLYGSRLITWGQRNCVQNLLNMSFDGGALPNALTFPAGWSDKAPAYPPVLVAGHFGIGLRFDCVGGTLIDQQAYQDAYGAPIAQANIKYKFRAWVKPSSISSGAVLTVSLKKPATAGALASVAASTMSLAGGWVEGTFNVKLPVTDISSDLRFSVQCSSAGSPTTMVVDELSLIYADNPYLDRVLYASYVDNPEAFDGVAGKFGSSKDQRKVMDISDIRDTGYFLTQDPGGRIHEFMDNGVTEPAGWAVRQVAANCGLLSAFGLAKSQADDSSASGGEEWFVWTSKIGARMFGGDQPWEISREIQPDWLLINTAFQHLCWALNDPVKRTMYFGLTLTGNPQGVANRVYSLNYVGLESAFAIGTTGPIRISSYGKRIATDHSRKWTRWNAAVTLNGAALMSRGAGDLQPVFFGGNGTMLNTGIPGTGQAYTLNSAKYTDDDYGRLYPYYVTFFMPGEIMEEAKEIAGLRKLLVFLMTFVSAPVRSILTATPYADQLTTPWPLSATRQLSVTPASDIELAGGQAVGNRIAVKFSANPLIGATDCGFNLQRLTAWMRKARLGVRGSV